MASWADDGVGGLRAEEVDELATLSHLTRRDVVELYSRFKTLDRSSVGHLTEEDLLRVPAVAMNPMADHILKLFGFRGGGPDRKTTINFTDFVKALSAFSAKRARDEVLESCFDAFDEDRDGLISRDEFVAVVRTMVGDKAMRPHEIEQLVDAALAEADVDNDGALNFAEFSRALDGAAQVEAALASSSGMPTHASFNGIGAAAAAPSRSMASKAKAG